jgi:hypothetical protein
MRAWRDLSGPERLRRYLTLAETLASGNRDSGEARTVRTLAAALVRSGESETVEYFYQNVKDAEKRETALLVLLEEHDRPDSRRSLERLASRDTASIPLAPFRVGGLNYVLGILEDPNANIDERVESAGVLGEFGDAVHVDRLRRLQDDMTVCTQKLIGAEPRVLGYFVRAAIHSIEGRWK